MNKKNERELEWLCGACVWSIDILFIFYHIASHSSIGVSELRLLTIPFFSLHSMYADGRNWHDSPLNWPSIHNYAFRYNKRISNRLFAPEEGEPERESCSGPTRAIFIQFKVLSTWLVRSKHVYVQVLSSCNGECAAAAYNWMIGCE